jgi:hypothetical protein
LVLAPVGVVVMGLDPATKETQAITGVSAIAAPKTAFAESLGVTTRFKLLARKETLLSIVPEVVGKDQVEVATEVPVTAIHPKGAVQSLGHPAGVNEVGLENESPIGPASAPKKLKRILN